MPGIFLNPSSCCCGSACQVTISLLKCGTLDGYTGRIRVSKIGFSQIVPATGSPFKTWIASLPGPGTYLIESLDTPPPRHAPVSTTQAIFCGGSYNIFFPVAAGYSCPGCTMILGGDYQPVSNTLFCSIAPLGSLTLTYDPNYVPVYPAPGVANPPRRAHAGIMMVSYPGFGFDPGWACAPGVFPVEVIWEQIGGLFGGCGLAVNMPAHDACSWSSLGSSHGPTTNLGKSDIPLFTSYKYISSNAAFFGNDSYAGVEVTITVSE